MTINKLEKNIFIIAGEPSGDEHAANYVNEHKCSTCLNVRCYTLCI